MSAASFSNVATAKINKTIAKDFASRNWPLYAGILLLWILALIVPLLINANSYTDVVSYDSNAAGRTVLDFGVTFGLVFAAILCGIVAYRSYSYLNSSRSAVYFGMSPCKRSTIFLSAFVAGFLPLLAICVVVCLLLLVSVAAVPTLTAAAALKLLVLTVLQSFIFYGIGVFVAQLTGTALGFGLMYLAVNGVIFAIEELFRNLLHHILFGTVQNATLLCWTSPAIEMMDKVYVSSDGSLVLSGWAWLLAYVAASALLVVAANALNNRRHMELAGEFVVIPQLRPFLKYLFAILCGLALAAFLSFVCEFDDPWSGISRPAGIGIQIASWLVGSFLGAEVAQMLLDRNIRAAKKALKGAAILSLAGTLLLGALAADLFGFQHRVPEADQIENVEIVGIASEPTCLAEPGNVQEVVRAHQGLLDEFDANGAPDLLGNADLATLDATITYTLKNGRQLVRTYYIPYGVNASYQEDLAAGVPAALLQHALNSKEARESRISFVNDDADSVVEAVSVQAWNGDTGVELNFKLNDEDVPEFMAALKADSKLQLMDTVFIYNVDHDGITFDENDHYYDIALYVDYRAKDPSVTWDQQAEFNLTKNTTPNLNRWFKDHYAAKDADLSAYDMNS